MDSQALKIHVQERRRGDNGWIQELSKPMFRREVEELNGWIHKRSQTHVHERRRGEKWMDSEAF
jgi:hypothetical protein